jgi:Family of unknown function (DUF6283)
MNGESLNEWRLKRTAQCANCPWRAGANPREIPNGYCEAKHRDLKQTIAQPGSIDSGPLQAMACHETHNAHCIGWLVNQIGPGNTIALRIQMISCQNAGKIRLRGEQHRTFEETLP